MGWVEPNTLAECITLEGGPSRESDRSIVAMKHGNSCGAKGPGHEYALNENNGD